MNEPKLNVRDVMRVALVAVAFWLVLWLVIWIIFGLGYIVGDIWMGSEIAAAAWSKGEPYHAKGVSVWYAAARSGMISCLIALVISQVAIVATVLFARQQRSQ